MKSRQHGFTIVELLIVIVVIAILASITVVAFNGISKRANNSARKSEAANVVKLLEAYKVTKGDYPGIPSVSVTGGQTRSYCIGKGFPSGLCTGGISDGDTEFTDLLATQGTVASKHFPTTDGEVGPVVEVWGGGYGFALKVMLSGTSANDCPSQVPDLYWQKPNTDTIMCGRAFNFATQRGA